MKILSRITYLKIKTIKKLLDWIHDYIRDKVRLRKIRNVKGLKGLIINSLDSTIGWVLVCIIGNF